ncbi:MAG: VOC family protein [Cryomorphaceae bacterium]
MKGKVTGIGGIFFKSKDPKAMKDWYEKAFHLPMDQYGHMFIWRSNEAPDQQCTTQWSPMAKDTDYYAPSENEFMINYRVEHLDDLLLSLAKQGVKQVGSLEEYEYGRFAWVMDPEGRKIELWEPKDEAFL